MQTDRGIQAANGQGSACSASQHPRDAHLLTSTRALLQTGLASPCTLTALVVGHTAKQPQIIKRHCHGVYSKRKPTSCKPIPPPFKDQSDINLSFFRKNAPLITQVQTGFPVAQKPCNARSRLHPRMSQPQHCPGIKSNQPPRRVTGLRNCQKLSLGVDQKILYIGLTKMIFPLNGKSYPMSCGGLISP